MKNKKINLKLSKEEALIEKDIEQGKYSGKASKAHRDRLIKAVQNHRINLRIREDVINILKKEAEDEGLAYQTFINSILYKYAHGGFVDRKVHEEVVKYLKKAS